MHHRKIPFNWRGNKKIKGIIAVVMCFMVLISAYLGVFFYIIYDYTNIASNISEPDPAIFIPENSSRLYSMAMWYENNIAKNHMPQNMIVDAIFNNVSENGEVVTYRSSTDSSEWTGQYLVAEAARYIVHRDAGDLDLAEYALLNLTRALRGIERNLYVSPNGGMARYTWPVNEYWYPELKNKNHYYGEFEGEQCIFEDDTSRDMHNGVIMGLGFAYYVVENVTIRAYIQRLVERMIDYFLERGWLYIDPNDLPNGTDFNDGFWIIGTNGIWTLALLKVATLVNPEKYGALYNKCAYQKDYLTRGVFPPGSKMNTVQSYFALLLDWELLFVLVVLEKDPTLQIHYLEYIGQLYEYTKWDRNALFHTYWLILNQVSNRTVENAGTIKADLVDCLMRYYGARQRLPGRNINLNFTIPLSEKAAKWKDFFENGIGGKIYPFYKVLIHQTEQSSIALTPDMRPRADFLWSRPPYTYKAVNQNGLSQASGVDFTVVYWLARWANILGPPESKNAEIEVVYGGP